MTTAIIDDLNAQLAQMIIPANMMDCTRCAATGTYGTHGKCYSCKGSRRVLIPAIAKIARRIRKQLNDERTAAAQNLRAENDAVLARYSITMDHVRYVMNNGVTAAWELANRYAEQIPFTAADEQLLAKMNEPI